MFAGKWFRGYVTIRFPLHCKERILNLCSMNHINVWDIYVKDTYLCASIYLCDFRKLRPIMRKCRTKAVVLERYGLPFLYPKLRKKAVLGIASLLCVCALYVSSGFIWKIEYEGNTTLTRDRLSDFLEEYQIHIGTRKKNIDIASLEKEMRKRFDVLTWVSVKIDGTDLILSVKEYDTPVEVVKKEATEEILRSIDLVANKDGTVLEMLIRNGTPRIKAGDEVKEGDILIEGKFPIMNDDGTLREYKDCTADADIYVSRKEVFFAELPFTYTKKAYTGRTYTTYDVLTGNHLAELPPHEPYLYEDRMTECIANIGSFMPFKTGQITSSKHREYLLIEQEYTRKEAELILNRKILHFLKTLEEKGVQIIEKNVKIDTNNVAWTIYGDIEVIEKIGVPIDSE